MRQILLTSLLLAVLGSVAATAPADSQESRQGLQRPSERTQDTQRSPAQAGQFAPEEHDRRGDQRAAATSPDTEDALDRFQSPGLESHGADHRVQDRGRQRHPPVLFDAGAYLIAEMPAAQCLPKRTRDHKAIVAARKKFETNCGKPTNKWKELGAVAIISGVGFFDIPHTQKPHAGNFAELHPVTGIKFVSGCGA